MTGINASTNDESPRSARTSASAVPTEISDPINARILAVSEDRIAGFVNEPFAQIAFGAELSEGVVIERLRAMLSSGVIRRIRQTLMATNLAPGALVAWRVDADKLDWAFNYMVKEDPFSGHVVIRSTDADTPGSTYRLWTTIKVPQGFSLERHCEFLSQKVGAQAFRIMPAKRLFALGVGHVRRHGMEPGSRSDEPGRVLDTNIVELSPLDWRVLTTLKREFTVEEIAPGPWR
ncbi:MAG TPA: hypothetical protein VK494_04890, partial [Gemmatimonadaceae bacterium]|nr:hypothetical protein [Gemmatimonadaceae bacterium]